MLIKTPTAAPNGLIAAVLLAFLATAGLFYVNIIAAIVDGLVEGLGISEQQAGQISSANIYGAAIGALFSVALVKRLPWKPLAIVCLLVLIVVDIVSIGITSYHVMLPVRLGHGVIGGLLTGTAFAVIARSANPDRAFGMLLFVQFGLGGLAYYTLPPLAPLYGTKALFCALILFAVVTLLMVPFLDKYPVTDAKNQQESKINWPPFLFTIGAIFFFQAANMGLFAYIFRLGLHYELERAFMSKALFLATWVALLGPFLVMLLGDKFGRFWPMLCAMLLTLIGTAIFHLSAQPWAYFLANCGTGITWGFVIAYLFGMSAEFDKAGRTTAFAGFVSKMGLASGPLVASSIIGNDFGYSGMINLALIGFLISMVILLVPAYILDSARSKTLAKQ